MKTVVLGPRPHELETLIECRRALGLDTFDEVWEGTYHVAPAAHPAHGFVDHALAVLLDPYARAAGLVVTWAFDLGAPDDYRVPDTVTTGPSRTRCGSRARPSLSKSSHRTTRPTPSSPSTPHTE